MECLLNDSVHFGHATNQDYPIEVGWLGGGSLRGGQKLLPRKVPSRLANMVRRCRVRLDGGLLGPRNLIGAT
jgi:hypothetical protein